MKIVLDLKVVMDTNVFISGVFFSGPPYQILKAWQSHGFELVVSPEILDDIDGLVKFWQKNTPKLT